MATKAKTSGTPSNAPAGAPEAALAEALKLFHEGKAEAARTALEGLLEKAREQGSLGLERTAQIHLKALESRMGAKKPAEATNPEGEAQVLLNRREGQEALSLLDAALAKQPTRAQLSFLKAVALAQLGQAEASAEALNRAIELDAAFLHIFRLETDFDDIRATAPFARF